MKKTFIELQKGAGLSNQHCALYLGISEGAVKDRRLGRYSPSHCELLALAVKGTGEEEKAQHLIKEIQTMFKE